MTGKYGANIRINILDTFLNQFSARLNCYLDVTFLRLSDFQM
jgi:hypothetical protein